MLFIQTNPNANLEGQTQGYKDLALAASDLLQVNTALEKSISNSGENLTKMDREMSSIVKHMGVTTQYSQLLKQELGRAVTEVALMGGKQEDINKLQKDFIDATNRTTVLSTENIEKLFAVSQVSGVAVKALETGFRNAGMETTHISDEMKIVYNTANSLGVNAQTVSANVVGSLDKMNRYGFGTGIEGLAKMAAKAAAMRVDMTSTFNLADKLFSPEAAIDVASTLQRLGATSSALLDPLKLMDLAQNNVPELQNQLSELSKTFTKFDEKTGKFQIMPEARKQLKEVADALGIDRAEFEKMALESAKIEKKMSEIDFSGLKLKVDEDQKMMLANLAEFNKQKGDYTVKFTDDKGAVVEKALNELQQGDLERIKLQQQTLDPQKELVDVAKQQLGASNTIFAQAASIQATLDNQFAISNEGQKLLETAVKEQTLVLQMTGSKYSLKPGKEDEKLNKEIEKLYGGFDKILQGTSSVEDTAKFFAEIAVGASEIFKDSYETIIQLAKLKPDKAAIVTAIKGLETADSMLKSASIDIGEIAKKTKELMTTFKLTLPMLAAYFKVDENELKTEVDKIPEKKDVAINANGQMFSLDKGDLMMAVNQDALLQSIGGSGTIFNSNTAEKTKTTPTEIKISLDVNANTNDLQVRNAILSAFNNDDTVRTLTDKIANVAGNYGLTV